MPFNDYEQFLKMATHTALVLIIFVVMTGLLFGLRRGENSFGPNFSASTIGVSSAPPSKTTPAYTLFAPGTPSEVIAEFHRRFPEMMGQRGRGDNAFTFDDGDRWSITAVNGPSLKQGDPITLTWSLVPDGATLPVAFGEDGGPSNLISRLDNIYGIGPGGADLTQRPWFPIFLGVFEGWQALTGVTYVYEPNDDGAPVSLISAGQPGVRGDVRLSGHRIDGRNGILAYNFFPNYGDMVIDTDDSFYDDTTNNSIRLRNVLSHEHGHGLGISHVCPLNESKLMEPIYTESFEGPQFDDILAANRGYGDNLEPNDTTLTATDLGTLSKGAVSIEEIVSIDDNSDVDYFRLTIAGPRQFSLSVAPSGLAYLSGPQGGNSCSPGTIFDASAQNDVAVQVLDNTGLVEVAGADLTGLGGSESLTGVSLPQAGTYFIKISGKQNTAQLYTLALSLRVEGPDLAITKTVTPRFANPGDPITYTIAFSNIGTLTATNVTITAIVPISLTTVISTHTGPTLTTISGTRFIWETGNLAVDEAGAITLTALVGADIPTDTVLVNTASIGTSTEEGDVSDNLTQPVLATVGDPPIVYLPLITKNQ